MKGMISELRAGVGRVNDEILAAAGAAGTSAAEGGEIAAEAAERFSEIMVAFQEGSTARLKRLEVRHSMTGYLTRMGTFVSRSRKHR